MKSEIRVTELYRTLVKGTMLEEATRLDFIRGNPEGDRRFMVVDQDGHFMSARRAPRICLIRAEVLDDLRLKLTAQVGIDRIVHLDEPKTPIVVQLHDDRFTALDLGDGAATWLTSFLGLPCRLVEQDPAKPRLRRLRTARGQNTDLEENVEVSFADGYPVTILSEESVGALAAWIRASVSITRFRPTIVVRGAPAFDEDFWRDVRFEGQHPATTLRGVNRCSRCTVPSVNPWTATIDQQGLLRALERMGRVLPAYPDRPDSKKGTMLGMNCIFVPSTSGSGASIEVGDRVTVVSRWA